MDKPAVYEGPDDAPKTRRFRGWFSHSQINNKAYNLTRGFCKICLGYAKEELLFWMSDHG